VCPSVCPLILGVTIRVQLYILFPSECPFTSVVPIRVPLYISCSHQSAPLHQLFPSEYPFTSGVPIRVPLYISCSPSECPFTSGVPIRVPLYIRCSHIPIRLPPFTSGFPESECPHTSTPFYHSFPISGHMLC
ncbi:unnamed protein product, partial [Staurois parvus]